MASLRIRTYSHDLEEQRRSPNTGGPLRLGVSAALGTG